MRTKTLEDELSTFEARARGLEVKLWDVHDMVVELELRARDCEVEITKKEEYAILFEDSFAEATAKSLHVEGQICAL